MTSPRKQARIEDVLAEFDSKRELLTAFANRTKSLAEELLQDGNVRYQSVQARVKAREKLKEKYLDAKKGYQRLDDITDQVALRVITYYEDEVDQAAELIKEEFEIDSKNSVDKRETEPEKFGYYALNYVCKYPPRRTCNLEYKKFTDIWCEIQITSILRHAWSEIEHPWYDLKDAFPNDIKRRFARMAALLEIAESEFLALRKIQSDYQKSIALQVEAKVYDVPVDAVSLRSFIEQEPLVAEIDRSIASALGTAVSEELPDSSLEFWSRAAVLADMKRLEDIRDSLRKFKAGIPEFVKRCQKELWPEAPIGGRISKGLAIYHLALMLVSARGPERAAEFLERFRYNPYWNIARQVAIAKEIVARY